MSLICSIIKTRNLIKFFLFNKNSYKSISYKANNRFKLYSVNKKPSLDHKKIKDSVVQEQSASSSNISNSSPVNSNSNSNPTNVSTTSNNSNYNSNDNNKNKSSYFSNWKFPSATTALLLLYIAYQNRDNILIYFGKKIDKTNSNHILIIEKLNDRLESYKLNLIENIDGKEKVRLYKKRVQLLKDLNLEEIDDITIEQLNKIILKYNDISNKFKKIDKINNKEKYYDYINNLFIESNNSNLLINKDQLILLDNELDLLYSIAKQLILLEYLTEKQKNKLNFIKSNYILSDIAINLINKYKFQLDIINIIKQVMGSEYKPKAYVLTFKGDLFASNLINLREEISAIIRQCNHNRGDIVILKLDSGGGTVTGYGLASSQLLRLRDSGINLTVCVDEVAASGGYMMASVGNTIVAAPFAILGSIGVVTTIPNFSERLKREGVTVFDVTAGKFKRTLTPYKPTTDDDKRKVQDDLENVLNSFKSFLKSSRPNLNVDKLATGETWQGMDALKLGLCDKISTSDDILLDYYNKGYDVLFINHKIKEKKIGLFDLDNSISILVSTFIQEFIKQLQYNNFNDNDNHQNISHSDMFKQRILAIDTKIRPDAGY